MPRWFKPLLLLSFTAAVHLLVLIAYVFRLNVLPFALPSALLVAIALTGWLAVQMGMDARTILIAAGWSVLIIVISFLFSWFYFDFSWDGQWYHQAAIYNMAAGWNPVHQPLRTFDGSNDLSIMHFPKGAWYYAAAALATFGNVELGKSLNLLILFAAIQVVYALCRDLGLSGIRSGFFTFLVVLNPVVWSEVTTFLVDGNLYLYLVLYVAALVSCIRRFNWPAFCVGAIAVIGMVNIKFTGLVFFAVFAVLAGVWMILRQWGELVRFILLHAAVTVVAVLVFGFNPYVTNTVYRGHPFYPIMGTRHYPSIIEQTGRDDNEFFETPKNMVGKNLAIRLVYANFGRPGNAPYNNVDNAQLAWPFAISPHDWTAYDYHETRISGFGPFFGGILLLALGAAVLLFVRVPEFRWPLLLAYGAIFSCLVLSRHFWWPRFFPIFWLVAVLPLLFLWYRRTAGLYSWVLAILIGLNGMIVLTVHMHWETTSSIALRRQMDRIISDGNFIAVDYGWFKRSVEEKLKWRGIRFVPVSGLKPGEPGCYELTSVVEGYPNVVLYRSCF